jgi:hypothetical protein
MTNPNEHNLESSREGNEHIELILVLNIKWSATEREMLHKFKEIEKIFYPS